MKIKLQFFDSKGNLEGGTFPLYDTVSTCELARQHSGRTHGHVELVSAESSEILAWYKNGSRVEPCEECDGTGEISRKIHGRRGPGLGYADVDAPCETCVGSGWVKLKGQRNATPVD